MRNKFGSAVLALGLTVAGGAFAGPFYMNPGAVYGTTSGSTPGLDTNTLVGALDSLGWTDSKATSIYQGLTVGSTVVDTNDPAVLATYGIAGTHPAGPGGRTIATINPNTGDPENFIGSSLLWGANGLDGGKFWGLTYTYTLTGEITASGVEFTSGYFDIFFQGGVGHTEQLLRLNLDSFGLVGGGNGLYTVLASGGVSFDWTGDGNSDASDFAKNFFVDVESDKTFYELWADNAVTNPFAVSWRMDNNIDCPPGVQDCQGVPLPGQLTPTPLLNAAYRQTTVDGTVRFDVPEPGSLALVGLGLSGLAMVGARRRRR